MKNNSQSSTAILDLGVQDELSLELMSPLDPAGLEISVFFGDSNQVDPTGTPDRVIDLVSSELVARGSSQASRNYKLNFSAAGIKGNVVVGIFSLYYADPSLSQERFTNVVGWVLSLNATGA
ncbi:hypothetical protein [Sinomonas sp. ASV322]|uniref:hypothetical protein n=1 Tax=Sinomonas sp. ASV322 TaxID=3041920 RepID=UPI0027DC59A6|nr:hypothetical protein [Sinomonas sp. ASV322]MDQ4503906.1 hypothetical protein [Sinomonas sp. ASV322]